MTFLGNPCPCGFSLDDVSDVERLCSMCGRRYVLVDGSYWSQMTPLELISDVGMCRHNRRVGTPCPFCPHEIAERR